MLSGPDDSRDALLTIHPGRGRHGVAGLGGDAAAHVHALGERHGFDVTLLDLQPGEEAGIKSATIEIKGQYAYGYLKAEKGVHRLVRISPFDSQSRRHTSFASVFVYPVVDDAIEIRSRTRTCASTLSRVGRGRPARQQDQLGGAHHARADGHRGGVPERAQPVPEQGDGHEDAARGAVRARAGAAQAEKDKVEAEKTEIGWGNQIRSYVFQPYTQVTDHRTELKVGDVQRVMDGDIDPFIEKFLKEFGARVA
jgi:peptide chain release factor 2